MTKTSMKVRIILAALLILCSCSTYKDNDRRFTSLDRHMEMSGTYEARKVSQIESLKRLAHNRSGRMDYNILMEIADEYYSYSFDSASTYLHKAIDVAREDRDKDGIAEATINLGLLYSTSGHFLEAYSVLFDQIDSSSLGSDALLADYYYALYRFGNELRGNSGMAEYPDSTDKDRYGRRLQSLTDANDLRNIEIMLDGLLEERALYRADSLCSAVIAQLPDGSHDFAKFAYTEARIKEMSGDRPSEMEWLVKSAEADMINSVKDYASLTVIAQRLMPENINRSFGYLNRSFSDATFYNAKLRPWQISQFFMQIQSSYERAQAKSRRLLFATGIAFFILALTLFVLVWFLIKRSRNLTRTRNELASMNSRISENNRELKELNRQISESNSVKEEYIGLFLTMMSENIDKKKSFTNNVRKMIKQGKTDELLRQLNVSYDVDDDLESFYNTFDTTFLSLYPDFVEAFNSLLEEEARVYPKKGELLNTELRIFALIRLGIDDSNKIASLLHYSVSTIYNYKVRIKKGALGDKEKFEEKVRKIGSIQA